MDENLLELLYRSLDGPLSDAEQRRLDEALASYEALRAAQERLLAMRNALAAGTIRSFGPGFTERVMERVRSVDDLQSGSEFFFQALYRFFRPIACAAATAALAIMTLNMLERGELSLEAAFAMPQEEIGTILATPLETILEDSP